MSYRYRVTLARHIVRILIDQGHHDPRALYRQLDQLLTANKRHLNEATMRLVIHQEKSR